MEFNKENFEICLCEDGSLTVDDKECVKVRNKSTGETKEMPYTECISMQLIVPTEEKHNNPADDSPKATDASASLIRKRKIFSLWGELETNMLHSLHAHNLKLFSSKTLLWEHISQEINKKFGTTFSPFQVECRFERKKRKLESSKASSTSRNTMAYYREVERCVKLEEKMQKRQRDTSESSTSSSSSVSSSSPVTSPDSSVAEAQERYLKMKRELVDIREQNREKRHEEKMKIIQSLADTLRKYSEQ